VRAGRDRAARHELAALVDLVDLVEEHLGVAKMSAKVEFAQHTGDDMHHPFMGASTVTRTRPTPCRRPNTREGPMAGS